MLSIPAPIPLHNPGCNDPNEICSPHPTGPTNIIEFYINNPEVMGVVLVVFSIVVAIGRFNRWRAMRE